jgi:hypothetical protein
VVDRRAMEQVFSEFFGFPYHSFFPAAAPHISPSIIQSWYNKSIDDHINSGLDSIT